MYAIGEPEIKALTDKIRRVMEGESFFRYGGVEAEKFEQAWAKTIGVQYAVGVNQGTSSLVCGLVGVGVGPGDEVIVPAYTFMASPLAVLAAGAIPVIADIDETLTLDAEDVERRLSPRTKAIMPVHMGGLPSNMDALTAVAKKHNLLVVEDCCQADGGSYKGRRLGSIGNAGGFSFNFFKIISCGDGGAMTTNDQVAYERALIHHDGGCIFRPHAASIGVEFFAGQGYRMTELQAAVLNAQLERLEGILAKLRHVKQRFHARLEGHPKLRVMPSNDIDGDCGCTVAFNFESEEQRIRFSEALGETGELGLGSPIDSGRHIYTNWDPILQKRGAHHPDIDPYRLAANAGCNADYSMDMCQRSLDIMTRNAGFGTSIDWTDEDVDRKVRALEQTAEKVL